MFMFMKHAHPVKCTSLLPAIAPYRDMIGPWFLLLRSADEQAQSIVDKCRLRRRRARRRPSLSYFERSWRLGGQELTSLGGQNDLIMTGGGSGDAQRVPRAA